MMGRTPELPSEQAGAIDHEDVDEVIALAARLAEADKDRLSVEDLERIGAELEIPPHQVRRAVEELGRRRQREAARRAATRRRLVWAGAALSALVLLLGALTLSARASLEQARAEAQRRRAQVENVVERRERTRARHEGAAPSPERDAELAGADNRVSIERRRYDEGASAYNALASGLSEQLAARLFGLPARVPLSNEIGSW
ncbi:hypothetical protein SOCEGT47_049120 [Sorangium cellulosum]|uniref:Uncharacterized protein n=1 Tax=Sorangium cellulosum TaxID=56 RepID=A0A4P2Q4S3_SORCE|nr:hypothetical protein [Sorangium cellulosum]AUX24375.1 hypothetical protein SOCEGT47_049120 [Sorangium cellulosum]